MPLDPSDLDELYGVPLKEFLRARKALAQRLRRADRPYDAATVEELKKPRAAVWAINQIARQDRVGVERLLRTVERLRALQLGRGGGDAEALRAATTEQRKTVSTLTDRAGAALRAAGLPPSRNTLERIETTLQAASVDEAARRLLRQGQLTEERQAAGFEAFAGTPLPRPVGRLRPAAPRQAKLARPRAEARRRLVATLAAKRAEIEALRERAKQAQAEAAARRRRADEGKQVAERAAKDADRLAAEVKQAEQALKDAERQLGEPKGSS